MAPRLASTFRDRHSEASRRLAVVIHLANNSARAAFLRSSVGMVFSTFIEPPSSPVTCNGSTFPSRVANALVFVLARVVQVPDQAAFAASDLRSFKDGLFESRRRIVRGTLPPAEAIRRILARGAPPLHQR